VWDSSPHGWGIELLAETQKANRHFDSDVLFDSTVTAARARLLKYFGGGRTQPYAGGSLGVTRITSTRESPTGCALVNNVFTCTGRDMFRTESTAGTLSGSAGVRIAVGNVMFVRPEFKLSKAGEHMRLGAPSRSARRGSASVLEFSRESRRSFPSNPYPIQ